MSLTPSLMEVMLIWIHLLKAIFTLFLRVSMSSLALEDNVSLAISELVKEV